MTRKGGFMARTNRWLVGLAFVIAALFPLAVQSAQPAPPTIVSSSTTTTQLTINGANLAPGAPSVLLGSFGPLAVVSQSATQLVLTLPALITPGTYTLSVKIGTGNANTDESVVTI